MQTPNIVIIACYLAGMLAFGWWGRLDGRRRGARVRVRDLGAVAGHGDRRGRARAEPGLRPEPAAAEDLHRLADAHPALRLRGDPGLLARHAGLHVDAGGHLHRRLCLGLRRGLRMGPVVVHHGRRRDRAGVRGDRRQVVDHPGGHGAVPHHDGGPVRPDAAGLAVPGRRLVRAHVPPGRRVLRPQRHGAAVDHHLLRHLHPRPADRPGHLAARVHRSLPGGRPLGWHRRRRLLHPLRRRRGGDRHDRGRPAARYRGAGRCLRHRRPGHPAPRDRRRRPGGRGRRDDVHRLRRPHRGRHRGPGRRRPPRPRPAPPPSGAAGRRAVTRFRGGCGHQPLVGAGPAPSAR